MNYLVIFWHWYIHQNRRKQLSFALSVMTLFLLCLGLCWWVIAPQYAVLFNHLDPRDANQIIQQLEQDKITYQVQKQGSEIHIAKPLIDKIRIKMMNSNFKLFSNVGFELFDKNDFGMSDFSQKINYQRALQGELERTISSLDEIRQARVHLVLPERHLFQQEENQPHAAVSLQLIHPLTPEQVSSIQQLIAASVAHLKKNKVIIVDQNGNKLTINAMDLISFKLGIKKNMENYLNEKVIQILNRVFIGEEVLVKVDVTLNYDELERELLKPQQNGILTHEKETQHSVSTKTTKPQTNQDLTREKSYQFGRKKEHFKRASGKIERLTLSVVVPQRTTREKIQQIERLVKSVVGFEEKRGDTLSVEALLTPLPPVIIPPVLTPLPPSFPSKLPFFSLCCGFTVLFFYLLLHRHGKKQKRQQLFIELKQWLNQYENN